MINIPILNPFKNHNNCNNRTHSIKKRNQHGFSSIQKARDTSYADVSRFYLETKLKKLLIETYILNFLFFQDTFLKGIRINNGMAMSYLTAINIYDYGINDDYESNSATEYHFDPSCEMLVFKYYRKKKRFYIYIRQCYCNGYDNIEVTDINFRDIDDMWTDGVFIHDEKCYRRYTQTRVKKGGLMRIYVHRFYCSCTKDEYMSYIR